MTEDHAGKGDERASEPGVTSELRSFGLLVGGVFLVLGSWWLHRDRFGLAAPVLGLLGSVLVLLGAIAPRLLERPRRAWMTLAEGLSFVMTRVILLAVFALVLTPIGLLRRAFGADPLRRRAGPSGTRWEPYPARHLDPKHYESTY